MRVGTRSHPYLAAREPYALDEVLVCKKGRLQTEYFSELTNAEGFKPDGPAGGYFTRGVLAPFLASGHNPILTSPHLPTSPHSPIPNFIMSENLDKLMLLYLDTIDTYQSLRTSLGSRFSAGFLALAQAKFYSPSRRYGQDSYDERMSALKGIGIREEENGVVFESRKIDVDQEDREEEKEEKGKREKEVGKGGIEKDKKDKDEKSAKKPDHRDPIRWFGILVPPELRTAQSEFTSAVEADIPQLLTTLSKLSFLESQISRMRTKYLYKILIAAPPSPLPRALPLSPLDLSSGFIHLCAAAQIPGVINNFMGSAEKLWLLKIPCEKLGTDLKWESVTRNGEGKKFPHLFNEKLGVDEVEDVKEFNRGSEKGWEGVFNTATWLQG